MWGRSCEQAITTQPRPLCPLPLPRIGRSSCRLADRAAHPRAEVWPVSLFWTIPPRSGYRRSLGAIKALFIMSTFASDL